ncbi:MAG: CD1871A family CXXC motif-containing protein [Faecousia sp.]
MTAKQCSLIRRVYGVLLSISLLAAGICLMAACIGIYQTGDHPFSREVVAAAFRPIAAPVYLCLGLTILGFPLNRWLPKEDQKHKAEKPQALVLQRLHSKTDLSECDEELRSAVAAQQKSRALHSAIRTGLLVLSGIIFLTYVLSGDRFRLPDINGSMLHAMGVLLPCLTVTFAYAVFTAFYNRASIQKEIALMKQANAASPRKPESQPEKNDSIGQKRRNLLRGAVFLAAAVLLIYGFFAGGAADVLTKAINICTECVGLG